MNTETMNVDAVLDIPALQKAEAPQQPFPYMVVPAFVKDQALVEIERDFPKIPSAGSFPLDTLSYGKGFDQFMRAIQGDEMQGVIAQKLGINLKGRPTMITVRGQTRERDGQIHTDSKTKLVTVLIYLNGQWENQGGRLRLLKSPDNLNDMIVEVPPIAGTMLAFLNTPNAWHGHEPFAGQRRAIQLNWVTDQGVVWREQMRHRVSAFFKKFKKAA